MERIEQNGNLVVEHSWMAKYDERSGKKVTKDSPLFKKFLEDKYEKKCWFGEYVPPLKTRNSCRNLVGHPRFATLFLCGKVRKSVGEFARNFIQKFKFLPKSLTLKIHFWFAKIFIFHQKIRFLANILCFE